MTEPTSFHSIPRGVMVTRLVTSLWGDGWVPLKFINTSGSPMWLRRNAKIADLYSCIALEDFDHTNSVDPFLVSCPVSLSDDVAKVPQASEGLKSVGLEDLNIGSCDISDACKQQLVNLKNRRTLKDAHPLPHQADCLAALGGNALFSKMPCLTKFSSTSFGNLAFKWSMCDKFTNWLRG